MKHQLFLCHFFENDFPVRISLTFGLPLFRPLLMITIVIVISIKSKTSGKLQTFRYKIQFLVQSCIRLNYVLPLLIITSLCSNYPWISTLTCSSGRNSSVRKNHWHINRCLSHYRLPQCIRTKSRIILSRKPA